MKVMMLIQHAEEKGNWSSKKYEISKWSFGDAYPVTEILFTATPGFSIQILDDKQINNELVYFLELFLSQEPIYKLTQIQSWTNTYASFPVCVCMFVICIMLLMQGCRDTEWIFNKLEYNIYYMLCSVC